LKAQCIVKSIRYLSDNLNLVQISIYLTLKLSVCFSSSSEKFWRAASSCTPTLSLPADRLVAGTGATGLSFCTVQFTILDDTKEIVKCEYEVVFNLQFLFLSGSGLAGVTEQLATGSSTVGQL
jgi:hypothetical protein